MVRASAARIQISLGSRYFFSLVSFALVFVTAFMSQELIYVNPICFVGESVVIFIKE